MYSPIYYFGEFQVDVGRRLLRRENTVIPLNSKTFDLLLVFLENSNRLLTKKELLEKVWPGQFVEESNLPVHIRSLRKAFGEERGEHRFIVTVPGQGYRFVAGVRLIEDPGESIEPTVSPEKISGRQSEPTKVDEAESVSSPVSPGTGRSSIRFLGNRKFLWAAAAVLILVIGLVGYWFSRKGREPLVGLNPRREMKVTRVTEAGNHGAASISADGKFVAYVQNATPGMTGMLYLHQVETNTVRELLEPDYRVFGCTDFSHDGSLIYYAVIDAADPQPALYSVPVLGGAPKRLMGYFHECFSLSPESDRIAFFRQESVTKRKSLMTAAVDGSQEQELLSRAPDELDLGTFLAWAPDGDQIAFAADTEPNDLVQSYSLFGVNVSTGAVAPLSAQKFAEIGKMVWTRDGRTLIFVAKQPRGENQLYLMVHPSGEVQRISKDAQVYGNYGLGVTADSSTLVASLWEKKEEIWTVSADGDTNRATSIRGGATNGRLGITTLPDGSIVYVTRVGKNLDIWKVKGDGSGARALTTDAIAQTDVAASPDGRYLVFASDNAGTNHIFRMNAVDGSEVTQLTSGARSDSRPDVSPNGEWVFYDSSDGKDATIWKVPIAGGVPDRVTDFTCVAPAVSPDGRFLVCIIPSASQVKKKQRSLSFQLTAGQC